MADDAAAQPKTGNVHMSVSVLWVYRILTLICASLLIIIAVKNFIDLPTNIRDWFVNIYYILLAVIAILGECNIKWMHGKIGILESIIGRGIFLIFLGTIALEVSKALQLALSIVIMVIGVLYLSLGCHGRCKARKANA
eukprot:CAMPEP_0176451738 /NCGR_PEP_ID=MMETSP0127-20121128/28052_1 /TAXON_ID=938130 /ORGANISM="Platyophrya macrostoma, Strain WH" /LENGTH=138 /DNA_ID=CAMNT_0017839925 /DNA_START=29 /DNA_END=445 /DNA_ORIENTATION=-